MTATTNGAVRILGPIRKRVLQRRIRIIVAITITYNVIEAIIALAAGTVASSAALIGFGLDSIVKCSPRLRSRGSSRPLTQRSARR
jgi:aryl carrier-like protein